MNGAESLVRTLLASGIDICFANPGTSEMHFVAALDRVEGMRCILGMAEIVVTGCADGYGRMAGKPAATLLHCGPGFANGIANLHNARRAHTPMVNLVGDHAQYHRPFDPPLTADTEGLARASSDWVRVSASSETLGADGAAAVQSAKTAPGQIATLIMPADTAWKDGGIIAEPLPVPPRQAVTPSHHRCHRTGFAQQRTGNVDSVGSGLVGGRPRRGQSHRLCQRCETAHADAGAAHGTRPRPRAGGPHPIRGRQCRQGAWRGRST